MSTFDDPAPMARPTPAELDAYRSQSVVSDPGEHGDWLDAVRPDPASMRETAVALVHHYRAFGDPAEQGFAPERIDEIDLRYADTILGRLRELDPTPPPAARAATDTVLGCCRDHTLLMVTQLRRRGVPARARVGFAGYFVDPWMLDHVVAEVWDAEQDRWRLMDCESRMGTATPPPASCST